MVRKVSLLKSSCVAKIKELRNNDKTLIFQKCKFIFSQSQIHNIRLNTEMLNYMYGTKFISYITVHINCMSGIALQSTFYFILYNQNTNKSYTEN